MIKKIFNLYKNLDKLTSKILKHGLEFCFFLCISAITILITYEIIFSSPTLFHMGLSLFKLSVIWGIEFIICALVVDSIKKQVI